MFIYMTGERERTAPVHTMFVAPANDVRVSAAEIPQDWRDPDGTAKTFPIYFNYGRAEVDDGLGRYLIATGQASKTNLIVSGGRSLFGALATALRKPIEVKTQY